MNGVPLDFARVYEDAVWRVYGFLAYRVGDRDVAEDLTQTTFERALRAWGRFDPRRGSEATWLLAIARNVLIDHLRRGRPHQSANWRRVRWAPKPGRRRDWRLSGPAGGCVDPE